ncbi:hypothetical protein [Herbiconiux sp. UC225_62]|uniref:hypothetical protein n=1 Tax=Herbiconiux sp. UC225_62 TaxID=3350168 RepID=UPI0036D2CB5A
MTTKISIAPIEAANEAWKAADDRLHEVGSAAADQFRITALEDALEHATTALAYLTNWAAQVNGYLLEQDDVELIAEHLDD